MPSICFEMQDKVEVLVDLGGEKSKLLAFQTVLFQLVTAGTLVDLDLRYY